MQIIAVDIGNSATKILVGEDHARIATGSDGSPTDFGHALTKCSELADSSVGAVWAVVSVNAPQCRQLEDWVKQHRPDDRFEVVTRAQVPLEIIESYRSSVGIDRLVAAYAATSLQQQPTPLIIVDAGTAVTIDVVSVGSAKGRYRFEGGVIFPGAGPSLGVLNSSTANLPDVSLSAARLRESESVDGIVGQHTDMAIANGVCLAQAHAVAGIVAALQRKLPVAEVWITGGGAENILELLKIEVTGQWIADLGLVLQGAMSIGERLLANEQAD